MKNRYTPLTLLALVSMVSAAVAEPTSLALVQKDWLRARMRPDEIRASLANERERNAAKPTAMFWVFLTDKGVGESPSSPEYGKAVEAARATASRAARKRRAKLGDDVGFIDLPVSENYVQTLASLDLSVRSRSRWLNAVGVEGDWRILEALSELPFVAGVRPILIRRAVFPPASPAPTLYRQPKTDDIYGASRSQLESINAIPLLERGLTGSGVTVGLLDSGFDFSVHEAFGHLNVIAKHDFVFDDEDPSHQEGQDEVAAASHGSEVLSILAGYAPGELIGPAHNAAFLLAKTEWGEVEVRQEEDFWVEGLEWVEQHGADIVSTSLGYRWFDDNSDYLSEEFDGQTAVTTVAAQAAFERGVVVICSAGNEDSDYYPYGSMSAPADGEDVIGVGAVDAQGVRATFSSTGPTADGRIKPDVCAMGVSVRYVNYLSPDRFGNGSGTSYAAPLVAAAAALLLESHPDWTAVELREALLRTATQAGNPDNLRGYGSVDAEAADRYGTTPLVRIERSFSPERYGAGLPGTVSLALTVEEGFTPDGIAVEEDVPLGVTPSQIGHDGLWNETTGRIRWFLLSDFSDTLTYTVTPPTATEADFTFSGQVTYLDANGFELQSSTDGEILWQAETCVPLAIDTDGDYEVSTSELLAAAEAWKRGETPTTSELLTAATIWKHGGTYLCDVDGEYVPALGSGQ